ncbi:MAG: lipase family protein [Nocardioides sp.]|jgi:pimeloyl-ACP methyl ester carboxylesterase
MLRRLATVVGVALLATVLTAPANAVVEPPRPTFYEAPSVLPSTNGAVIRSEQMTYKLDPLKANTVAMNSWRILYRSTNRVGKPIAVSGTVLVPKAAWFGFGRRPVIGYAAGTQGMADKCAPSRQFSEGLEYEGAFISGLLARGYAVVMTDYEGLGTAGVHTYMDRVSQGRAVLDSVRAAQRLSGTGLSSLNPVGLQGYSQGGGAAASAAELAASYAPELSIKGASVGAVPADLKKVAQKIDGTMWAEFLLYAARGLSQSYGIDPHSVTNDLGDKKMDEIEGHCVFDLFSNSFVKSSTLTDSGQSLVQIMDSEPWRTMVEQQRIGTLKPAFPVLVTHSALDDTIPYDQGKAMAKSWCAKGANVRFSTNLNPGHLGGMLATSTEMYGFFEARFAGLPQWSNCWIL